VSASLSSDQVAALVEAAKDGSLPDQAGKPGGRRTGRLRNVDFTRPTKFTNEQERRLRRALETFCRTVSTRLSAELRSPVDLEVINLAQLTWANAHDQVTSKSICAILEPEGIPGRMLLTAEMSFVLASIERLLGNNRDHLPRERKLTDVDWALTNRLFGTLVDQLSIIWQDFADLPIELSALENHTLSAHVAPVNEPTLSLTLEARLDKISATLVLLIPWRSIAPVAERFSGGEHDFDEGSEAAGAVRGALRSVEVVTRAEVGAVDLPVAQVLALQPGELLRLGSAAGAVTIYADNVAVHRAKPGRSGLRRAVQVLERLEGGA